MGWMLRWHLLCIFALALGAFLTAHALAQVDTGAISGVVADSTGAIVPGVKVTVTQSDTNARVELVTNDTGFYSAASLGPSPYQVEVSKQRFQPQKRTGIGLRVQDRLEVNFTLSLGSTTTELTVTTAAPVLADGNLPSDQRTIQHWFNTAAFAVPTCICFGNSGRGVIRGPGFTDVDFSIVRSFHFGERFRLQFRAESFNPRC
jgi:hypothetical protein